MFKTCVICGRIHDINIVCSSNRIKKKTKANLFRKTNRWKEISVRVRNRDKYLCQACLTEKYKLKYKYNYSQLEVHHIVPIDEDYSMRLDSNNLITLCKTHHHMAEIGQISRKELKHMMKSV